MLVALCYCLHGRLGGFSANDEKWCGHSRLPEQPDQPLPLHDHQQRRQVEAEEDFPVYRPQARHSVQY